MKRSVITVWLTLLPLMASAQGEPPKPAGNLTDLKLEDLMKVQVTTASRRAQNLSEVPAAISVLTQEDIRRSGITTIPELLRLIPGMQVARITANRWAISARGFNNRFASYLQVLVDGRSVYTLDFAGVYWDQIDTVIEDIERIEVIRGPQATLWGANAVNGVINIITKHSKDTRGQLATATVGSLERASGEYRYGGALGNDTTYRVYGKYLDSGPLLDRNGDSLPDGWSSRRVGFRFDKGTVESRSGAWLATGETFSNPTGARIIVPRVSPISNNAEDYEGTNTGYHILARWETQKADGSNLRFQTFLDNYRRRDAEIGIRRDKVDFDLQYRLAPLGKHNLITGLGYRYNEDHSEAGPQAHFDPASAADKLYSSFVQDGIAFRKDLQFIVGTRIDHNRYTGFEWQPTGRLSWTPTPNRTYWAAVSRAVRLPSRGQTDLIANLRALSTPFGTPLLLQVQPDHDMGSVSVVAHELGIRFSDRDKYSADVSVFYNLYKGLNANILGALQPGSLVLPTIQPVLFVNGEHGDTVGTEISSRLSLNARWQVGLGYSYMKQHIRADPGRTLADVVPPINAQNQVQLTSNFGIARRLEIDNLLFYVDGLTDEVTPAYIRFDTRIGWKATDRTEISITGQNLFSGAHYEFRSPVNEVPGRVPTSVLGKVVYRL